MNINEQRNKDGGKKIENTHSHTHAKWFKKSKLSLKDHFIVHDLSANLIRINHHLICYHFFGISVLYFFISFRQNQIWKCETDP